MVGVSPVGQIVVASEDGGLLAQAAGASLLAFNRLCGHGLDFDSLSGCKNDKAALHTVWVVLE